ncbi:MAG: NAD(P)-binding protein [Gammaproteobacteria bacterium]|nr:NAD(P)-binding protein [Gammaproteobacteria bacterium]
MPKTRNKTKPVCVGIIGGGWAGLTTAVELASNGMKPIVIESARQLGGRARCVKFNDLRVDNGQHLLTGACSTLLNTLDTIGINEEDVFQREPLQLLVNASNNEYLKLSTPSLPAPFHLLIGMLSARGISLLERVQLLRFGSRIVQDKIALETDVSVQALLLAQKQSARLVRLLWEPLAIAILNTPIKDASARIFIKVLQESFSGAASNTEFLFPSVDLSRLFPIHALDYIEQNNGKIILSERVSQIDQHEEYSFSLHTNKQVIACDHIVIATSPDNSKRLLENFPRMNPSSERIGQLGNLPICTIYLRYPTDIKLSTTMIGLLYGHSQWVIDRAVSGQPGLMSVVISGPGSHMELDPDELGKIISQEIAEQFPLWPAPLEIMVIRDKRATFAATTGVDQIRPKNKTAISGLWLAGDYTDTGLPSTLEGAMRSGSQCAQQLIDTLKPIHPI